MYAVMMATEPQPIEVTNRSDGMVNVYLRKNIRQTDDGWEANEVSLTGYYQYGDIEEHFDQYWHDAEKSAIDQSERFNEIEALQADQDAAICELYEMMIGDEE